MNASLTANETSYLVAARLCSAANSGLFCPSDLRLFGYASSDETVRGTTGSLVAKGVIGEPEDGWTYIVGESFDDE